MMSVPMTAAAQNVVAKEVISPRTGQVVYTIPLPSSWQVSRNPNSQYFVTGPNGLTISHSVKNEYFFGSNMGGFAQNSRREYLAPMSAGQYFQQILKPYIQSQGHKFLRSYPLPESVTFQEKHSASMPNTGHRRSFQAIGSDWQTGPGETSMVSAVLTYVQGQAGTTWDTQFTQMEVPSSQFEAAKKAVRYGVANAVIGRDHQGIMNGKLNAFNRENKRKEDTRARQEDIRHQGEMGAIAARGKATRDAGSANSDILDSNMESFRKIQAMKDGGQAKSVRNIRGETIISDPTSGRRYTAPSGSRYNWVNENGELIRSDNPNYNPNTDNNVNQNDYKQYEPED